MYAMFYKASAFNQPLGTWNTSKVTTMSAMFNGAKSFNQPLDNWDTSKVTDFTSMFKNAQSFNQDLSNWHVNATVTNTFTGSGLSQENYCKLQSSSNWTTKPPMSQYTCG